MSSPASALAALPPLPGLYILYQCPACYAVLVAPEKHTKVCVNSMTPDQLEEWKKTLAHRAQRLGCDPEPHQANLVNIPDPPAVASWVIEWRWRNRELGDPWKAWRQMLSDTVYEITNHRAAKNRVRQMRRAYPLKEFRLRPHTYDLTPGWENTADSHFS